MRPAPWLSILTFAGAIAGLPPGQTAGTPGTPGKIDRLDPAFDALVAPTVAVEKVAGGFNFTEGPLWRPDHTLWFSDVQGNVVRSLTPDGKVTVLIRNAGGVSNPPPDAFIGSNGMAEAPDGSVWMVQHGARQIVRVGADRTLTPVVSRFEGKRFNSPNDLVFAKDGALYFTDPPYGLARQDDDPAKELTFNGVYRFANGRLQALVRDLNRPNGLAFSPDFKMLYVNNSDPAKNLVMRYEVDADGTLANGRVLADLTSKVDALADGMKVDARGIDAVEPDAEPWATPRAWAEKMRNDTVLAALREYEQRRS